MDTIDLSKYKVEIQPQNDDLHDELIQHLLGILNDRSIPEEQKQNVRKQFDEVLRIKSITMKPPTLILTPKE